MIWGGEFGRMPVSQGSNGRDHNPNGFLVWMAGAGIKGGASHGETDESAIKPLSIPSPSTTCTPRCCTCWASTTSG